MTQNFVKTSQKLAKIYEMQFLVACYATLHPALSVHHILFFFSVFHSLTSLLWPKNGLVTYKIALPTHMQLD